jgi:hypothetical protein
MKKAKRTRRGDLRRCYPREDFPTGLVRGKYASRVPVESNVVRRDVGQEILEAIREIKRGEHGRVTAVPGRGKTGKHS